MLSRFCLLIFTMFFLAVHVKAATIRDVERAISDLESAWAELEATRLLDEQIRSYLTCPDLLRLASARYHLAAARNSLSRVRIREFNRKLAVKMVSDIEKQLDLFAKEYAEYVSKKKAPVKWAKVEVVWDKGKQKEQTGSLFDLGKKTRKGSERKSKSERAKLKQKGDLLEAVLGTSGLKQEKDRGKLKQKDAGGKGIGGSSELKRGKAVEGGRSETKLHESKNTLKLNRSAGEDLLKQSGGDLLALLDSGGDIPRPGDVLKREKASMLKRTDKGKGKCSLYIGILASGRSMDSLVPLLGKLDELGVKAGARKVNLKGKRLYQVIVYVRSKAEFEDIVDRVRRAGIRLYQPYVACLKRSS